MEGDQLTVWVDLALAPTFLAGRGFTGSVVRGVRPRLEVSVSASRVSWIDCVTGAVEVRAVDDAQQPARVPFVVYEYALDVIRRLVPHLRERVSVDAWDEFVRVREEAFRLTGAPLDAYAMEVRERLAADGRVHPDPLLDRVLATLRAALIAEPVHREAVLFAVEQIEAFMQRSGGSVNG